MVCAWVSAGALQQAGLEPVDAYAQLITELRAAKVVGERPAFF